MTDPDKSDREAFLDETEARLENDPAFRLSFELVHELAQTACREARANRALQRIMESRRAIELRIALDRLGAELAHPDIPAGVPLRPTQHTLVDALVGRHGFVPGSDLRQALFAAPRGRHWWTMRGERDLTRLVESVNRAWGKFGDFVLSPRLIVPATGKGGGYKLALRVDRA